MVENLRETVNPDKPLSPAFSVSYSIKNKPNYSGCGRGSTQAEAMARAWMAVESLLVISEKNGTGLTWDHFVIGESGEHPRLPEYPINFQHPDGIGIVIGTQEQYDYMISNNLLPPDLKEILEARRRVCEMELISV